jgi:hypothetical protein
MKEYKELVQYVIREQKRWFSLRLIRDVKFNCLSQYQRNELFSLEQLAEESR